jgi:FkbM family methyltransferase
MLQSAPGFRGKVRLGMRMYDWLGLHGIHIPVETTLRFPTPYRVRLDMHCQHERMALLMNGYEAHTTRFLSRCSRGSGYLLDIGANIGLIGVPYALLRKRSPRNASQRMVYCIEPIRANYNALVKNILLNDLDREVSCINCGVGADHGAVEIQVEGNLAEGEGTGTANILPTGSTYACERIPLIITSVDRLIDDGVLQGRCDVMKLDTDGYDFFALQGATQLLSGDRPIVFGEFMDGCLKWHGQTIDDVQRFVQGFDYRMFVRKGNGFKFKAFSNNGTYIQDVLMIPSERLSAFDWCIAEGVCR